jgi:hypothetical protein
MLCNCKRRDSDQSEIGTTRHATAADDGRAANKLKALCDDLEAKLKRIVEDLLARGIVSVD